jgi:proline iminopeptidase
MSLRCRSVIAILLLLLAASVSSAQTPTPAQDDLFPEIEPYDSGYLKVSDLHEIYYEQSGNPQGKAVFFLHGGPGGSTSPTQRRYFDPKKFRIVLHDQRGAGKSRPFAETRENDTWALVGDIERLRQHLGIDRMILLGGSWGSTLALAYAEKHPERVSGLILRGVYLGTRAEMERFYTHGVAEYFPEVSERLWSQVPNMPGKTPPQRLMTLLDSPDEATRKRIARAWAAYETKVAFLTMSDEEVEKDVGDGDPTAFSRIENHYMAHDCFLEENQLLRDVGKIKDVPTIIVNGRYDVICPPKTAYLLHKAMPRSQLWIIEAAGHSGGEPGIQAALVRAVRTFE